MYRTEERPRKEPTAHVVDTPTRTDIIVRNGETTRIAFPCYYVYRKDGMPLPFKKVKPAVIDHYGWPRPDRRDHSFQPHHIPGLVIEPIHLSDEGYDTVEVALPSDVSKGFSLGGTIDDFIVRVNINAACDEASEEELRIPYSIMLSGFFNHDNTRHYVRDIVTRGEVRVLPSLWDSYMEEH